MVCVCVCVCVCVFDYTHLACVRMSMYSEYCGFIVYCSFFSCSEYRLKY